MSVLAHDPGVHRRRHMTQRRNLADFVEILVLRRGKRFGAHGTSVHGSLRGPGGAAGTGIACSIAAHNQPLRLNARKSIRLLAIQALSLSFDGIYAPAGNPA